MPDILSTLNKVEPDGKGNSLSRKLIPFFAIIIILGISLGYMFSSPDVEVPGNEVAVTNPESKTVSHQGVITYVDPRTYPADGISYYLADSKGDTVILLWSSDRKLEVSEGHYATVEGVEKKTKDGKKDYLDVAKVIIKNESN